MAQLKFKRFSDLAFLQSIDKPLYFSPLLLPFTDYFGRQGVDVSKLKNDDATDRRLLAVFTKPDEDSQQDRSGCRLCLGTGRALVDPSCGGRLSVPPARR